MHLIIYIDLEDNHIICKVPHDEEEVYKVGEIIFHDNQYYSVLDMETEEFLEYELIIHTIHLAKFNTEDRKEYELLEMRPF